LTLDLRHAFTLIELLVVIAVIGTLAALILPVVGAVKKHQYIYNAQAEMAQLETAIERYKSAYGFYPPSNTNSPGNMASCKTNQLYYELIGTTNTTPNTTPTYQTLDGSTNISASDAATIFGVGGFMNCSKPGSSEDSTAARSFLTDLRPRQLAAIPAGTATVKFLVVSVGGPDAIYQPMGVPDINPWRYNSLNPTNNPGSYELWVQLAVGGKTNLICNWTKQVQVNSPLP